MECAQNVDATVGRLRDMLDLGLYDSVEAQCSLMISSSKLQEQYICGVYSILAEAVFLKCDYARALT